MLDERLKVVVVVMLEVVLEELVMLEGLRLSENISHWLALAVLRPNSN